MKKVLNMKGCCFFLGLVNRLFTTSLILSLAAIILEKGSAYAQIAVDGTLKTTVSQNGNNFTIANGSAVGSNLFHSFQQFSVPTGGSAIFNLVNTPNISTIFSRVTGGSVSNIDGLIQTINSSNPVSLFLLNPNGIVFGPNAKLNISGSFIASTASSIRFGDGVEFSATAGVINPLLTMSVPIGLQMGQNPGAITVQGSGSNLSEEPFSPVNRSNEPIGLQVGAGNTLALIGGQVNFSGGVLSTNGGGHLEVGSVSNGEVKLNSNGQGWVPDYSGVQQFNDIYLAQQSLIDASGSGGSIQLQGRNISLTDGSTALIQNVGAQPSGGITVNTTGYLTLQGNAANGGFGSQIRIDNLGKGQTGDITISATQLSLQNGGEISIQLFTLAPGGNIEVNVTGSININGFIPNSPIATSVIETLTTSSANAGNLAISTGNLSILDGGSLGSATVGSGQAGMVLVNVKDLIEIAGDNPLTLTPSALNSVTLSSGNAGNTIVNTSRLVIQDSGFLGSTAVATGSAGNVSINASDSINIQGKADGTSIPSLIASNVEISDPMTRLALGLPAIPTGSSGSLTISTPSLSITNGASATVINDGPGKAGDLQINANSIFLDQGSINAATASGNGGNIRLNLQDYLLMRNNSLISVTAKGSGNGGNLSINAPIIAGLENSDIIANAVQGQGGNIYITTEGLFGLEYRPQLTTESDITASSQFGLNGTVEVNTTGVSPNSSLVKLPENFTDHSQQITTGCSSQNSSSFVATGKGGIPPNPNQQLPSDRTWSDVRDLSAYRQTGKKISQVPTLPEIIVQATGWQRNDLGKIELIADKFSTQVQPSLICAAIPKI
jgi:filamentous hemagglutinin family protein